MTDKDRLEEIKNAQRYAESQMHPDDLAGDMLNGDIKWLIQKVEKLTKERDRFKRIAGNLLIEYNQILEDEYARGPNKLEDFNEDFVERK